MFYVFKIVLPHFSAVNFGGLRCGGSSLLQNIQINTPTTIPANGACTYTIFPSNIRVCQVSRVSK